ncbi:MAG TPA: SIS domain-containing protein [Bdellovibrionota bacterium]|nr:SIS domain-containing protein [Bdellovibrionota bacterium]
MADLSNPQKKSAHEYLSDTARETVAIQQAFLLEEGARLVHAAEIIGASIRAGGKLLILGNGGSAADAQHMAAEMVGKLMIDRPALPAIALTTDSSNLTAIANDYGYDRVFARQVEALARKGDVVLAISTSGNSPSVLHAIEAARGLGCRIISLTGGSGGKLKGLSEICLNVSLGKNSSRIQETHIFAIHSLVDLVDRYYLAGVFGGPVGP